MPNSRTANTDPTAAWSSAPSRAVVEHEQCSRDWRSLGLYFEFAPVSRPSKRYSWHRLLRVAVSVRLVFTPLIDQLNDSLIVGFCRCGAGSGRQTRRHHLASLLGSSPTRLQQGMAPETDRGCLVSQSQQCLAASFRQPF